MTAPQSGPSRMHLTGALSGTGHDILRATVYTGTVPSHPPPELADSVYPVYDRGGAVRDWRLGGSHPGHHIADAVFTRFREWRSGFAQDRFLGERALFGALLDWLDPRCDTSALGILRLPSGHVDFHAALKMKLQVEAAGRAVAAAHEDGLGLYTSSSTHSAMRVFIPTQSPTLLLGVNNSTLTAALDGLSLQSPDPQGRLHAITGWRSTEDGLIAAGQDREVDLTGRDAATLLRVAGRQAPIVEVRNAPLHTLVAPLLVFLRDAATLAGDTGADLHLRSGWA